MAAACRAAANNTTRSSSSQWTKMRSPAEVPAANLKQTGDAHPHKPAPARPCPPPPVQHAAALGQLHAALGQPRIRRKLAAAQRRVQLQGEGRTRAGRRLGGISPQYGSGTRGWTPRTHPEKYSFFILPPPAAPAPRPPAP